MKSLYGALSLLAIFTLAACSEPDGPAENAGEKIDETMEETKQQIDSAVEQAGEKLEEAGDSVREKTQ